MGRRRVTRSRRPMRCSTSAGSRGRSKRTSRRQNSKLRPSPPHSVEIEQGGPAGPTELRHLQVAPVGGQVLVEDRHPLAGGRLQPGLQGRQGGPVVHEDERLALVLPSAHPGPGRAGEPDHPRVPRVVVVLAREPRPGQRRRRGPPAAGRAGGCRRCPRAAWRSCRGAAGGPPPGRPRTRLPSRRRRGAAARAGGRSRARRPRAGVADSRRTWRAAAASGAIAR